jgi:hypothetical protein
MGARVSHFPRAGSVAPARATQQIAKQIQWINEYLRNMVYADTPEQRKPLFFKTAQQAC